MADEATLQALRGWIRRTREAHAIIKEQEKALRAAQQALAAGGTPEASDALQLVNKALGETL